MATIKLVPSAYTCSSTNTNYIRVTNPQNMYYDTSHTANYATIQGRNSNSTYYCLIHGFDFTQVPSNAVVSSFVVKIKAYESQCSTSSTYRIRLASTPSNNNAISGTTVGTSLSTSTQTLTIPTGTLDWATIKNYGTNFSIDVPIRRSGNSTPYIYVYGAEIEVTYTVPIPRTINSNLTGNGTIVPNGSTTLYDGDTYNLYITPTNSGDTVQIVDNGVDVTSQLVIVPSQEDHIPESNNNSGFTIANASNAYNPADNNTYANLELSGGQTGTVYFNFTPIHLPAGATLQSISCEATFEYNRNNSSSGYTASCRLYNGNTAKGSTTTLVSSGDTSVAKTTFILTPGIWTQVEVESGVRLYITATNSASSTHRYLYLYGATLTVTYSGGGTIYLYTITVNGDHTIDVTITSTPGTSTNWFYKVNGTWKEVDKIFFKRGGSWTQVDKMFTKINGNWENR